MILVEFNIRRYSGLWGGVTPETVKRYREELEQMNSEIREFRHVRALFVSDELTRELREAIDEEIKYCLFYDEHRNRQSEPNFDQWVFRKQEDIPDLFGWEKAPGEQWTKTNGRIKAIIQFDRTSKMVKITLDYENDSQHIGFYEVPYKRQVPIFRLKSEESIKAAVEEFKQDADCFLEKRLLPGGSYSDFDVLQGTAAHQEVKSVT